MRRRLSSARATPNRACSLAGGSANSRTCHRRLTSGSGRHGKLANPRHVLELVIVVCRLDGDLDDHVVVDRGRVVAERSALADAALVLEHARVGLADAAIA